MGAEIILITSLAFIVYTYFGYPVVIFLLGRALGRDVRKAEITPKVSVIIAAYNERRDIARKLENTLALDYPREKLEIIVASDCSTDGTDAIVRGYADRGVVLDRRPERIGKSVAQNHAVKISTGEIIVFSDATTMYERDAVSKIIRGFADSEVGCVAGQLVYVADSDSAVGRGCRSYWGYEKFLKQCESRVGSLIGVSGCLYAVRRSSYARIALDMSSDFVIATEIHLQGLRTVYEREAIAFEDTNRRGGDEFRMRVRVIEQTISAIHKYREVLNPFRHGLYAFQMISHKVMRYAVPFFLLALMLSSFVLMNGLEIYRTLAIGQAAVYAAAMIGFLCEKIGMKIKLLALPYYFVLGNAATLVAFFKFLCGEAHILWEPLRETGSADGTR